MTIVRTMGLLGGLLALPIGAFFFAMSPIASVASNSHARENVLAMIGVVLLSAGAVSIVGIARRFRG